MSPLTGVHCSPINEFLVMTKLRGGTQLSQSSVGFGVSVKFRSSLVVDDGCSFTVYGIWYPTIYGRDG